MSFPFAFIGGMGYGEMMVVAFIALLLFGKRLPEVARSLGKGVTEFKKGIQGLENDVQETTTQHRELPHSAETQAPQTPKFEPPTQAPSNPEAAQLESLAQVQKHQEPPPA